MFDAKAMMYLYVETPLHAGSGTSLGVVDLPVQRERVTNYPMVQASGIKGKLRAEAYEWPPYVKRKEALKQTLKPNELLQLLQEPVWQGKPKDEQEREADKRAERKARKAAAKELGLELVFGPETDEASEHAGAFTPGDAKLLLFPVRSLIGVFAWTTSKDALARFCRDAKMLGLELNWQPVGPTAETTALVAPDNDVTADSKIVLEEFAFDAQENQQVKAIADWLASNALPHDSEYAFWRQKLPKSLVILPENAFRDFTQFSTEVINRIRLEHETKTVAEGALWSEEHLPTDTVLYAPMFATRPRVDSGKLPQGWQGRAQEVLDFVKNLGLDRIQLGGDETVGRGLVKVRFS
ncbi:MAG TPA: type III-B CRISPR module RAMP protein Cmr4 [Alphaproteobacteria bacterium]|nr:type III-B CRISPR module RAMP protein Cmr4 [Alphaproteobacteria bacterium]